MASWTLRIQAPAPFINANQRQHRLAIRGNIKLWRDAAHIYAKAARLPSLQRAHITATLHFPTKRQRDVHNWMPTIKAIVDGLVDYGLLPDDSDDYLVGPDLRPGEPITRQQGRIGAVELTIREA